MPIHSQPCPDGHTRCRRHSWTGPIGAEPNRGRGDELPHAVKSRRHCPAPSLLLAPGHRQGASRWAREAADGPSATSGTTGMHHNGSSVAPQPWSRGERAVVLPEGQGGETRSGRQPRRIIPRRLVGPASGSSISTPSRCTACSAGWDRRTQADVCRRARRLPGGAIRTPPRWHLILRSTRNLSEPR